MKKLFELSVYHSQQAAEKALKSVLILLGKEIHEHRVSSIFRDEILSKYDYPYLEEIVEKAFWLEQHWLKSKHPLKKINGKIEIPYEIYDEKVARKALEYAEFVLKK
ncbi:MAG: HEPN domain-containing protein [Candidatus Aenigmatarchaeota archaeon]